MPRDFPKANPQASPSGLPLESPSALPRAKFFQTTPAAFQQFVPDMSRNHHSHH